MNVIRAKKNLGQHFLTDQNIAQKIVGSLEAVGAESVLEIGSGMGVLTQYLINQNYSSFHAIEIDYESVSYLKSKFPELTNNLIEGDFLKLDIGSIFSGKLAIIGNFPYNISSQIFFKVLENKNQVDEVVGMLQKEVAERLCSGPGTKKYGILSVLLQAYYSVDYLFTVNENVFSPPPKVKSAVIRLKRNDVKELGCNHQLFVRVVKAAFNQRRKMLRNSMKQVGFVAPEEFAMLRPEQMSNEDFISLTSQIENNN